MYLLFTRGFDVNFEVIYDARVKTVEYHSQLAIKWLKLIWLSGTLISPDNNSKVNSIKSYN